MRMMTSTPKVSVGLPVYNAEQYLAQTIESIFAQTFRDFELVVSDNGSTDRTEEICRAYAAKDGRIRYFREEVNRGAAWNHNRVFKLSRGEYFKWASYDDLLGPGFLEKCVAVLDRNPQIVLCCTKVMDIDEGGKCMEIKSSAASKEPEPHNRFRKLIYKGHTCEEIYGLMRAEVLKKTPLIAPFTFSDQNLLLELSLYGSFHEVPEVLFFHRWHAKSTYYLWPNRNDRWLWFDPNAAGRILLPHWKQLSEFLATLRRVPVGRAQRARCYLHIGWWMKECRRYLLSDLYWGEREILIRWVKEHLPWLTTTYRTIRYKART
jgi:glycosyltransferase involved in cell wall biosynthesis